MSQANCRRTRDQLRHDFYAAVHTARVTLRALRSKIEGRDDLELLDGAAESVNKMAETFEALHGPRGGGG